MRTKDSYVKNSMIAEGVNAKCMTNFASRWIHNKIHIICVFLSDIAQPRDANMKITNILTENVSFKGIYTYDLQIIIIGRVNRGIAISCHKGSVSSTVRKLNYHAQVKIGKISVIIIELFRLFERKRTKRCLSAVFHAAFQRGACDRI